LAGLTVLHLQVILQSVTVAKQTVKMQLLQSQSAAGAAHETLASQSLLRSAAEAALESNHSAVQCMLLAVSDGGHSWSV